MNINKSSFYQTFFIVILLSQIYIPSFKINIFLQLAALIFYFSLEKTNITIGFIKTITPLIVIFFLGFLGFLIYQNPIGFALKDVFHFIKPILGILVGYFFYKKINNFGVFIKTIVLVGLLSALIHFSLILFFSRTETVSDVRELGKDNFLELFSLFFLLFYKKFEGKALFQKKNNNQIIFYVLLVSTILYFSRTMIIAAIIILFSIYGYTKITKNTLKIALTLLVFIGLLYVYLFSVKIDRSGNTFESFLYKVKIAPSEIFKTKIDRDNHKDLWDHWRGYEAKRAFALMNENSITYVFGCGYGSLVNLKFYAPLTGNPNDKGLKYISELHNGFPYILYKTGIIGLLIYLYFIIQLYKNIYSTQHINFVFISAIALVYLFTTLTITGLYNAKDTMVLILGALLFFKENTLKIKQS